VNREHHHREDEPKTDHVLDPVDTFLAQPAFEEEPGLDDAALERQRLLDHQPDAGAIEKAIELLNEHHPLS
jgi:hypothetical protein